jgi:multiple sugar transport system substrate-binding protein
VLKLSFIKAQIDAGIKPQRQHFWGKEFLNQTIPYYNQLISMLSIARLRPNIPEYPQIADDIRQAIEQIYNGTSEPKHALDEAAYKSAKALGW